MFGPGVDEYVSPWYFLSLAPVGIVPLHGKTAPPSRAVPPFSIFCTSAGLFSQKHGPPSRLSTKTCRVPLRTDVGRNKGRFHHPLFPASELEGPGLNAFFKALCLAHGPLSTRPNDTFPYLRFPHDDRRKLLLGSVSVCQPIYATPSHVVPGSAGTAYVSPPSFFFSLYGAAPGKLLFAFTSADLYGPCPDLGLPPSFRVSSISGK